MSTIKCITFVSTLLLASAQVSTLPRRLRRGAVVSSETNELVQDKEFGRQLEEMSMSLSMPSSMSVDLQQAGIEFMPIDETASMAEEATTAEPSYYPTYLPTSSPIGTSPTAPPVPTKSPSYWPTYIPSAQPVGVNPTKAPAPTTPPSYYPTYYPSQKPVGPTNAPVPTTEPSYHPTYYPTQETAETATTTAPTYVFRTPEPTEAKVETPAQSDMQPLSSEEKEMT